MVNTGQTRVLVLERNSGVVDDYRCALSELARTGPWSDGGAPGGEGQ